MKLNEIRDHKGARKARMRVGRGPGSGKGKTAGRGHKGQKARTGVAIKGFEGGQMPLFQRLPKRGFSNAAFRKAVATVNVGQIQKAIDSQKLDPKKPLTIDVLRHLGFVKKAGEGIKILGKGLLTSAIEIEAHFASQSAQALISKAKGKVTLIPFETGKVLSKDPSGKNHRTTVEGAVKSATE